MVSPSTGAKRAPDVRSRQLMISPTLWASRVWERRTLVTTSVRWRMQLLGKCSSLSTQLSTNTNQVSYLTSSIPGVLDPIYHILLSSVISTYHITCVHSVYFLCPTITTELLQLPFIYLVCSFLLLIWVAWSLSSAWLLYCHILLTDNAVTPLATPHTTTQSGSRYCALVCIVN